MPLKPALTKPKLALTAGMMFATMAVSIGSSAVGAGAQTRTHYATSSKVIYVIGYQENNPFWVTEGKGAGQAGKDFGVTVRYEAPPTSSDAGMISLIDAAMATHPYGIAIDYTDKTMQAPVLAAENAGIKVVLYNNDRFEPQSGGATTDPAVTDLAFVGQDEHHSGSVLGKAFVNLLPKGHGTVLIINPFTSAFVLTLRYEGVKSALTAAGYSTDYLTVNGNDPESTLEPIIGAYLHAHKGIVGVVGLGDPAAEPAAQYLDTNHMTMPVATFDIDTLTYDLLKGHTDMMLALDQQPFLQGFYAVQDLAFEMKYGFQPVSVNTGTFLVTRSNVGILSTLVNEGWD